MWPSSYTLFDSLGLGKDSEFFIHGCETLWLQNNSGVLFQLDVRGSVQHNTIYKEKSNKMQQCIKISLFRICMKLNMFRATHRPSLGA